MLRTQILGTCSLIPSEGALSSMRKCHYVSSAFTIRQAVPLIGMIGELSVFGRRTGFPDSSDHQALISLLALDEKEKRCCGDTGNTQEEPLKPYAFYDTC